MRFLIGLIFITFLHFSNAVAVEAKPVLSVHQEIDSATKISNPSQFSLKKESHTVNAERLGEPSNTVHHLSHRHGSFFLVTNSNYSATTIDNTEKLTKKVEGDLQHSYRFIFNCLYPKHSFW